MTRLLRLPLLACTPLLAGLLGPGCAGEPAPKPAPAAQEEPPPPPPAETPPKTRDVVVTGKPRFSESIMELQPGDLVEVTLTKGGRARGRIEALKPETMALAAEGTSVITRLTPAEVAQVRLVHRPPPITFLDGSEQPRDERESWLPRFAGRMALDGVPEQLWQERFARNVALIVMTPLELISWTPTGRMGDKVLLTSAPPLQLLPEDQVKLVATVSAAERKGQIAGADLGAVQVWLHKRGETVTRLITTRGLPTSSLDPAALLKLQEEEPSSFIAQHPGTPPEVVKNLRSAVKGVRDWRKRLESLPDRAGIRRARAQRPKEVAGLERDVRRVYAQMGVEAAAELGRPLTFLLVYPAVEDGRLGLVTWSLELGLD